MNILEEIALEKRKEVAERKSRISMQSLEISPIFQSETISLKGQLLRKDKMGLIAEFKRKSPSKGVINQYAEVEKTTTGYVEAGASGLSVLTDEKFFGGKMEDLQTARKVNSCPILRKDFMLDEYQVIEAKSVGADVILLIAAMLNPQETKSLGRFAKSLGLEVLLEVHNADELNSHLNEFVDIVGVNNRNLKTFVVSLSTSLELSELIPKEMIGISESGISKPETIIELRKAGFHGFLMGETFMRTEQPEKACAEFITEVNDLENTNL